MMKIIYLLLSIQNLASYFTGRIAPDERVVFFPTSASQWNETHWKVPIHGWIFQPKESDTKRRAFRSLLRRVLQVQARSEEEKIFHHRLKPFVVDNERWKRPKIFLAGRDYRLSLSSKNGHFRSTLIISDDEIRTGGTGFTEEGSGQRQQGCVTNSKMPTSVSFFSSSSGAGGSGSSIIGSERSPGGRQGDTTSTYNGVVMLVPPRGITIVSDIDDTIKVTNVVNKRAMLQNTFLKEFVPVPGMAEVYQRWCTTGIGLGGNNIDDDGPCHLHLLSASLYQLYEDLEAFRTKFGFPPASYTLKTIRPKDAGQTIQTLLEDAYDFKRRALVALMEEYPQRQFVLVGDTGEKDPHVYASMIRDYPHQVKKVLLRYVPKHQGGTDDEEDDVQSRVADIMMNSGIPREKWMVFLDASELNNVTL